MLTISNSLSHDVYYKMIDPKAPTNRRLFIAKALLLGVAVFAAYITSLKPGDILFLVGSAFSLAASAFFRRLRWACSGSGPTRRVPFSAW